MNGYQAIFRQLLDECARAGIALAGQGILTQLHMRADPKTGFYRTTARRLAEEICPGGAKSVEHVRRQLQHLRGLGLAIYPTDNSGRMFPIYLPSFILQGAPLRITRPWPQSVFIAANTAEFRSAGQTPGQSHDFSTSPDFSHVENRLIAYIHAVGTNASFQHREIFTTRIDSDPRGRFCQYIQLSRYRSENAGQSPGQSHAVESSQADLRF